MAKDLKSTEENDYLRLGVIPLEVAATAGEDAGKDQVSVLVFEVTDERYAIVVEHTEGVVDCPRLTPLPSAPDGVVGITSVRGRITLALDLSSAAIQRADRRRLILLKGDAQLGLLADRVSAVVALNPKKIKKLAANDEPPGSQKSTDSRSTGLAVSYFMHESHRVPIIDVNKLTES